jgi:predicted alpha/beta superfamily hydrolase
MLRRGLAVLSTIGALLLAGSAVAGTVTHHSFASATLGRDYAYNLYLPDGYEGSGLTYPVLYLLHARSATRTTGR